MQADTRYGQRLITDAKSNLIFSPRKQTPQKKNSLFSNPLSVAVFTYCISNCQLGIVALRILINSPPAVAMSFWCSFDDRHGATIILPIQPGCDRRSSFSDRFYFSLLAYLCHFLVRTGPLHFIWQAIHIDEL